jgi:hypothetical protein
LCSHIKKLQAEDENQSWDQGYKATIAQTVKQFRSDAQSKTSTGSSTFSSKSTALDKIFRSIPKEEDQDDEKSVECDKW